MCKGDSLWWLVHARIARDSRNLPTTQLNTQTFKNNKNNHFLNDMTYSSLFCKKFLGVKIKNSLSNRAVGSIYSEIN